MYILDLLLILLLIFCAFCVIFSNNPIHSILFLVLTFFAATGILLFKNIEFLGMIFLIVYVGAIAVLFLFVVMMLNIRVIELKEDFIKYIPILGILCLIFFFQILNLFLDNIINDYFEFIFNTFENLNEKKLILYFQWFENYFYLDNIKVLSNLLYVNFFSLFILSGIILLVSMLGAISLTLNDTVKIKKQLVYKQLLRDNSLTINHYF